MTNYYSLPTAYHLLLRCDFFNNSATSGGAVAALGGSLSATHCTFDSNKATVGGAVFAGTGNPNTRGLTTYYLLLTTDDLLLTTYYLLLTTDY